MLWDSAFAAAATHESQSNTIKFNQNNFYINNIMKNTTFLFATAASIALLSAASGQTVIDITGSTAGRSAVIGRVEALLSGESVAWRGNASKTSANFQIFYGGNYNGSPVTVRLFWSGSAAGVRDISNSPQLANSYIVSNYAGPAGQNDAAALAPASAATVSEIGFSDVFQTSTSFTTNTLTDEVSVAVIPFVFVKNDGAKAGLLNVTPPAFQAAFGAVGEAPLSFFTGNPADATSKVFATGRNNESGTRITTLANCYYGLSLNVGQYTGTVASDQISLNFAGNGGYSSGSGVAALLAAKLTGSNVNNSLIGYVGTSDAATAVAGGGALLKFNGIDYTAPAVYNGQYTLWGYLHQSTMLDINSPGVTEQFYIGLRDAMIANPGSGTLSLDLMNVERAADGAVVTPK